MSTPDRTSPTAQGGDGAVAAARGEREQRLAADEASLAAGRAPGHAEQLVHHDGLPSVETQQATHGQAAPSLPDTGGHDSPSDRIG
jgi:hypothetical protein